MGYHGSYTLLSRCVSECIATFMYIFLLETLLANKLLPKTKGHDLGFGWIATGIGFACFLAVQFLGEISTAVNPAMVLGNVIVGNYDVVDFFAIAASETLGAFLGAVMVWVYYLPHFRTVPGPPPRKERERLLTSTNDIGRSALMYASYDVKESARREPAVRRFYYQGQLALGEEDVLGHDSVLGRTGVRRRRSITVSDLRRRMGNMLHGGDAGNGKDGDFYHGALPMDTDMEAQNGGNMTSLENSETAGVFEKALLKDASQQAINQHSEAPLVYYAPCAGEEGILDGQLSDSTGTPAPPPRAGGFLSRFRRGKQKTAGLAPTPPLLRRMSDGDQPKALPPQGPGSPTGNLMEQESTKQSALEDASKIADQNAKLAVFCTRPAEYMPLCNIITEVVSTAFLVAGILFLNQRAGMISDGGREVYLHGIKSLYVGLLIIVLILSLGGPGIAMNPARDFGPRLAHYLLPIPGKGPSEWYYAWIPVVGPFLGGAVGALAFMAIDKLNQSDVVEGLSDDRLGEVLKELGDMVSRGVLLEADLEVIKTALEKH